MKSSFNTESSFCEPAQELSPSESEASAKAFSAACRRLSSRMRSEGEIRAYLRKLGFEQAVIEKVIRELTEYGYIDDYRYCCEYFRYAKRKGKADGRIIRELAEKGISRDQSRAALLSLRESSELQEYEMLIPDDGELAYEIANRLFERQLGEGKAADEKLYARIGRRLASLGYNSATIFAILERLRQDERNREADTDTYEL